MNVLFKLLVYMVIRAWHAVIRARPVFEKVAQIGLLNTPGKLWMREQSYSSEFFEFLDLN